MLTNRSLMMSSAPNSLNRFTRNATAALTAAEVPWLLLAVAVLSDGTKMRLTMDHTAGKRTCKNIHILIFTNQQTRTLEQV